MLIPIAHAKSIDEIVNVVISELVNPIKGLLIILAALFFLYGVVEFIAGANNETARTKGKQHMMWGILGMVIIAGAQIIITVIDNFFKQL